MELKKDELIKVVGGINITASFISAISKSINSILELGRAFGSSVRRIVGNTVCSV